MPEPHFNGRDGGDWRPAVPFWLRKSEPESEAEPQEPKDWRPAVPFWLKMPDPTPVEAAEPGGPTSVSEEASLAGTVPEPNQDAAAAAEPVSQGEADEATTQPSARPVDDAADVELPAEPTSRDQADDVPTTPPSDEAPTQSAEPATGEMSAAQPVDELPPEEDLAPLPGTTGEAVFFPPSSRRTFTAPQAASDSAIEDSAPDGSAQEDKPIAARSRSARHVSDQSAQLGHSAKAPEIGLSLPAAPYAQYDAPTPDWDRVQAHPRGDEEVGAPSVRKSPPDQPGREPRLTAVQRRWLIRGGIIGSVIGGLVVALVLILATQGRINAINGTITGAPTGAPEDVVSGYLNALAHSDSQQALRFAKLRPTDQRMLTDEMLAESNKAAPLRQIGVHTTELTDYRAQVEAVYSIGEQRVTQSFTVYAVGSEWKLYDVARKVDLGLLKTDDLPLKVNGISVQPDNVELFPGHYQVAISDDRYAFTKDAFVVVSPGLAPELGGVRLELSSTGIEQVAAAATSRLNGCLATHELQPAGCGFGAAAPKGMTVRLDTLRWKVTGGAESLKMLKPTLDSDNPRLATADVFIQVSVTAKDTKGGNLAGADSIKTVTAGLGNSGIEITLD